MLSLVLAAGAQHAAGQQWGVRPDGHALASLAPAGQHIVTLFFVASDCPISNRMAPEMQRLAAEFGPRGVQSWMVYPNSTETAASVQAHQRAFAPQISALLDPAAALTHLSAAVATPEMVVLRRVGPTWRPVYAGRIDNRFVRLGLERPAATEHDGEEALKAVLENRAPRPAVGAPVGCAIMAPVSAR